MGVGVIKGVNADTATVGMIGESGVHLDVGVGAVQMKEGGGVHLNADVEIVHMIENAGANRDVGATREIEIVGVLLITEIM